MKNSLWSLLPWLSWGQSMKEVTKAELGQQKCHAAYREQTNLALEFWRPSVLCLCSGARIYFSPSVCIQFLTLKVQLNGFSHIEPSLTPLQLEFIFHSLTPSCCVCSRNQSVPFSGIYHLLLYVTIR